MRQTKQRFDEAGAQIVLVGMGTPEQTTAFKEKFDLAFPMLSDPQRKLYNALKIGFMSLASTFSPTVAARAASALFRGHGVGIPHGDIRQLPAVFIIDTGGRITHSHIGRDPSDHPEPQEILEALQNPAA